MEDNTPFGFSDSGEPNLGSFSIPKGGFKRSLELIEQRNEKERLERIANMNALTPEEAHWKLIKERKARGK
jgi:hypothetical protein